MKIFVTGGAGFIGANFVRYLLEKEYDQITVLDKLTYAGNTNNLEPFLSQGRVRFVHGDICDREILTKELPGHDAIVHFAAETHVDRSIAGPTQFAITNVIGTQTLLQSAVELDIGKFVHVSTDEVYGSLKIGHAVEESNLNPSSPYSASKASSDLLALAYFTTYGLDVRVTRCTNNYGPYQFPEKLIPLFATNLIEGKKVPLYGTGLNIRDWLHVRDHCRAIELVLNDGKAGEIYNIGGSSELTNLNIAEIILDSFGFKKDMIENVVDRLGHDFRYAVNTTKIESHLGFKPITSFADGIGSTLAWYKDNASWWQPLKSG